MSIEEEKVSKKSQGEQQGRKVLLYTYGCQMNEYDTELVRAILRKENYEFVDKDTDADIVMLNTCAIRENAHTKVYGRIHQIRHDRNSRPVIIGLLGCMATNLRQELLDDKKLSIDFIAGPDSYKRLPHIIEDVYDSNLKKFDVTLSEFETYSDVYPARKAGVNAWLAIMRGCNNFCTFCVVPYTRGRERSRSIVNIVEEVKTLVADGFEQVTLLGQNVNSYNHDDGDFAKLLEAVANVDGIKRVRFTSPHPKDFPLHLLDLIADHPNICKQIHIPLQAGSDRILDLMNRTYTQAEFLKLVEMIRLRIPSITLSTDIIVGFCSETAEEFEQTMSVMKQVEFDTAFMFKYSDRKHTIAHRKMKDDVSEDEKTRRIVALNEQQKIIGLKKNSAHIGQVFTGLIENVASEQFPQWDRARLDNNKLVKIPSSAVSIGDWVQVKVNHASPFDLSGEIV